VKAGLVSVVWLSFHCAYVARVCHLLMNVQ
jgi:hypothetical protein